MRRLVCGSTRQFPSALGRERDCHASDRADRRSAFCDGGAEPPRTGARILDIGSAESTFPLSAASLGYRVTAIDQRPLAYSHPNLESHATVTRGLGWAVRAVRGAYS